MACTSTALNARSIEEKLKDLPQWRLHNNALERIYQGKSYLEALERLNSIARLSEAADHHPDLLLEWRKLTIRYWTHTAQGITDLDFALATEVEALLQKPGVD